MKIIGFIGAFDKTDLIMNVAKTLCELDKKVLVVDTTILEKSKFVVPSISPTKMYMTEFEKIDFAFGFNSIDEIYKYVGLNEEEHDIPYDYMLVDIDNGEKFIKFKLQLADENYFVTGFDMYSLKRGMGIIDEINMPVKLTKILFSYEITKSDEDYLEFLSLEKKIEWNDYTLYFTILREDKQTLEENQRVSQIRFRRLSNEYKDSLVLLVQEIDKDDNGGKIKKIIKG